MSRDEPIQNEQVRIMDLVETKHYYVVKVGKMWVRDKFVGYGDGELTQTSGTQ